MPKDRGKKNKFYVVFRGLHPGVYATWDECRVNVSGFPRASFASFKNEAEARQAFAVGDLSKCKEEAERLKKELWMHSEPMVGGVCLVVDAACSGFPGPVEFRGVLLPSMAEAFKFGPYAGGSNNIGEFLAIVTGFRWLRERGMSIPVFSDSRCAIGWVMSDDGKCNTGAEPPPILAKEIESAERWLRGPWAAAYKKLLRKWDTESWGEIPADFGRK